MSAGYGYEQRADSYPAEIAAVAPPHLLDGLLHTGATVAELPSGTGHFLRSYAAADATVVLVDATAAMLAGARPAVRGQQLRTVCCRIEDLTPDRVGPVALVVVPNAALNQLAAGPGLVPVLAGAARILAPGGLLLVQVLLADGDRLDGCGFYDPALPDGKWTVDRRMRDRTGHTLVRMRRQRRHGDRIHVHFAACRGNQPVYDHEVELQLLTQTAITEAAAAAGLQTAYTLRGGGEQLSEVLAARPAGGER